ncbi:MAG: DNA helicase RecQ [Methanoregulaceae archaeon]|jgi:ATP-dependent DNA helicase RecQ
MENIDDLLKKYWGYTAFLPHQKEIIESLLQGQDTIGIMATGGGKSLCYQLPTLCLDGLALVISPLISLMKDQVDDLHARGIPAAAYNSSLEYQDKKKIETDLKNNHIRLLFVSPEKCMQPTFLDFIRKFKICLIAIDEAHCISEWGHNFRPEYRQLSTLKEHFPQVPIVALTATAIPEVRKDIAQQLNLSEPREYIGSFNRKNLHYRILPKKNSWSTLLNYVQQHKDDSGIIYCLSKKETEELAGKLQNYGFKAQAYHAGLSKEIREKIQDEFIHDNVGIICATIAFGMGIDKPDVRFVIHYNLPKSVESYFQETGRAGRDGENSECILFYSRGDVGKIRSLIESDGSDERHVRLAIRKLQDMTDYCESPLCRRKFLLNYFGEQYSEENCGFCDNCSQPKETMDGTNIAEKIIECVKQLPSNFGSDLITDILIGSNSSKIQKYHFDSLTAYATCKEYSKSQCRIWIDELIRQGYLARTGEKYPVIRLTDKSSSILQGETSVNLSIPDQSTIKRSIPHLNTNTIKSDELLFLHLKKLRKSLADQAGVPPYVIFPDKSLREMAETKPCDIHTFRNIVGVGDIKLEKYGVIFISEIKNFCEQNGNDILQPDTLATPESDDTLEQIYNLNQEILTLNDRLRELSVPHLPTKLGSQNTNCAIRF